jgi:hypothetical protein
VTAALVEQRAAVRHRILLTSATVQKRGGRATEAMLHDLSVYGCRLACRTSHGEGAQLWLRFAEQPPIPAAVIWNDGEYVGCRFDAPIERSLMRSLTLAIC